VDTYTLKEKLSRDQEKNSPREKGREMKSKVVLSGMAISRQDSLCVKRYRGVKDRDYMKGV